MIPFFSPAPRISPFSSSTAVPHPTPHGAAAREKTNGTDKLQRGSSRIAMRERQTGRGVEVFILASRGVTVIYWEFDPPVLFRPFVSPFSASTTSLHFSASSNSLSHPVPSIRSFVFFPFSFSLSLILPLFHVRVVPLTSCRPFIPFDSFHFLPLAYTQHIHTHIIVAVFATTTAATQYGVEVIKALRRS